MITLCQDYSLKKNNTFRLEASAKYFAEIDNISDLVHFLRHNPCPDLPLMILGEGSNVLFKADFNGLIIHPVIMGIDIIHENTESITIRAGAGENWDSFVEWTVARGYGGIENLSLIPGSVGACPVQNIGAYGAEVSEVIESVDTINVADGREMTYPVSACGFGYRTSIFKSSLKNRIIITQVVFRLSKIPVLKTKYGVIMEKLKNYSNPDLNVIRKIIIDIRREKLPDPGQLGNAGSFFKNPVFTETEFHLFQKNYSHAPFYQEEQTGDRKIPAAWLIEQCGWKGMRIGNTGTWPGQPLVLVNYGKATGKEIFELSEEIAKDVLKKFDIQLEREVNVV